MHNKKSRAIGWVDKGQVHESCLDLCGPLSLCQVKVKLPNPALPPCIAFITVNSPNPSTVSVGWVSSTGVITVLGSKNTKVTCTDPSKTAVNVVGFSSQPLPATFWLLTPAGACQAFHCSPAFVFRRFAVNNCRLYPFALFRALCKWTVKRWPLKATQNCLL